MSEISITRNPVTVYMTVRELGVIARALQKYKTQAHAADNSALGILASTFEPFIHD